MLTGETKIARLELLMILHGLLCFPSIFLQTTGIWFVENIAALMALIKARSESPELDIMAQSVHLFSTSGRACGLNGCQAKAGGQTKSPGRDSVTSGTRITTSVHTPVRCLVIRGALGFGEQLIVLRRVAYMLKMQQRHHDSCCWPDL